jgi:hypothetical protein
VFVARLSRDLQKIERVSYLGGDSEEIGWAMAVGPAGIFVTGRTWSTNLASPGSAQPLKAGAFDAFVARFDADLITVRTTYVGGGNWDQGHAIAVSADSVYIAGLTSSPDFPRVAGGAQETLIVSPGHSEDAFVAKLGLDLTTLHQSTFLGGVANDLAEALAVSPDGGVYVSGRTTSKDFPFTEHGAQPLHTTHKTSSGPMPSWRDWIPGSSRSAKLPTSVAMAPKTRPPCWSIPGESWSGVRPVVSTSRPRLAASSSRLGAALSSLAWLLI